MNIAHLVRAKRQASAECIVVRSRKVRVLAVGDVGPDVIAREPGDGVIAASISAIDAATIAQLQPDIVLSPIVDSAFDCLDLAQILVDAGFAGRYRVISGDLPNPRLVLREVRASFPGLDVDLLES